MNLHSAWVLLPSNLSGPRPQGLSSWLFRALKHDFLHRLPKLQLCYESKRTVCIVWEYLRPLLEIKITEGSQ